MTNLNLEYTSALELSRLIRQKEISPSELCEFYLDRIEKFDRQLNSFVYIATDSAREDAKAKTEILGQTQDTSTLPPFFGIPTAIKDLYSVTGMPTGYGNGYIKDQMGKYDEGIVSKIKQAGMVILGKTATSEFGSLPYTESVSLPATRNPWNLEYTAGGSSAGGASAVASGLLPVTPVSDGGGSVRGPAFCCGLVGLKPSRGRISNAPVGDYQGGIATHGCISRTVADSAILLDILAGYITGDPYWLSNPETSFFEAMQQETKPLKIAFATSVLPSGEADDILKIQVEETAQLLADMGHSLTEGCPDFTPLVEPFKILWQAGLASASFPEEILTPMNRWLKNQANSLSDYLQAIQKMQVISRQFVAFFDNFDVLLLPTYLRPPIKIDQWANLSPEDTFEKITDWINPCPPFNATGQPAIAIPTGFTDNGLPVGVQLVGKPADEITILQLAYQLEQIKQWYKYQPNLS